MQPKDKNGGDETAAMRNNTLLLRISVVWLVLVIASTLSYSAEALLPVGNAARYGAVIIWGIAMFKVRLVILDFMELRTAPLPLRLINDLWVIALGATLIYLFWPRL